MCFFGSSGRVFDRLSVVSSRVIEHGFIVSWCSSYLSFCSCSCVFAIRNILAVVFVVASFVLRVFQGFSTVWLW